MPRFFSILFLVAALPWLHAQDLGLFGDNNDVDDFQLEEEPPNDYEKLQHTYFTELADWPDVRSPRTIRKFETRDFPWEIQAVPSYGGRRFVRKLQDQPITNLMKVPVAGTYRFWLGYVGDSSKRHPVDVTLSGANDQAFEFGTKPIPDTSLDGGLKSSAFRFESEVDRMSAMTKPVMVWEFRDVELQPGTTTIQVYTEDPEARLDAIVVTQSKTFVPSKSPVEGEGNLNLTYYRWRYVDPPPGVEAVKMDSFIHYMWAHYRPGSTTRIFYSSMGKIQLEPGVADIPVGTWSDWNEVTEQVTNSGRYLADRLTVTNAANDQKLDAGSIEVQLAWWTQPSTVLRTITNPLTDGWTRYLVPVARDDGYRTPFTEKEDTTGVWGAREAAYVAQLQSEKEAIQHLMDDIPHESLKEGVMPRRIRFYTSCRTSEAAYEVAIPLLKKIGINWLPHLDIEDKRKYDLHLEDSMAVQSGTVFIWSHNPLDPVYEQALYDRAYSPEAKAKAIAADPQYRTRKHWLKMGDEIGPATSVTHINGLPDCRAMFLDYLRQVAAAAGSDASYFGASDFNDLYYQYEREANLRLPQRRLFYHSRRFTWWFTAKFYERHSRAARRGMPNVITWCNYTPGGPMFAGDMDHSNWFALPRYNATNGHAGEDWLSAGSGYTSQAGVQTESYYGALVECGARQYDQDLVFLMVGRSGDLDRKMCTLVASNIFNINVYDWGPEFTRGAVDTFSHVLGTYEMLNRGARAIGPAEDVLIDGERTPRRVALLYNRTNEIWNGGDYGVFSDRLYKYLALRHSHLPPDLILEQDIASGELDDYDVLYLDGFNLQRELVPILHEWVSQGGMLLAAGGSAMRDQYDQPLPAAAELLGASQQAAGASDGRWMPFYISDHEPIDTITIEEKALSPALEAGVVGLKLVLTPTTGTPFATYADGSVAGVRRELGKGQVQLLGVSPGLLYANNAPRDERGKPTNYTADRRQLITKAAAAVLPPPKVEHTEPLLDLTCHETADKLAITVIDYTYTAGQPGTLSVRTDKPIENVHGTLTGELKWKRQGELILIDYPTPEAVDIVILE